MNNKIEYPGGCNNVEKFVLYHCRIQALFPSEIIDQDGKNGPPTYEESSPRTQTLEEDDIFSDRYITFLFYVGFSLLIWGSFRLLPDFWLWHQLFWAFPDFILYRMFGGILFGLFSCSMSNTNYFESHS